MDSGERGDRDSLVITPPDFTFRPVVRSFEMLKLKLSNLQTKWLEYTKRSLSRVGYRVFFSGPVPNRWQTDWESAARSGTYLTGVYGSPPKVKNLLWKHLLRGAARGI